jgi:AraC-like DNA-binding protein
VKPLLRDEDGHIYGVPTDAPWYSMLFYNKELLKADYIKIADIASMVGYSDTGYFSKVVRKYYGLSPSEFQNSVKD